MNSGQKSCLATARADCHRYFANSTSIVTWAREKKFWVRWAKRALAGNRPTISGTMRFPPHRSLINEPVNTIYHVPMQIVYGNGIDIPSNSRHSTISTVMRFAMSFKNFCRDTCDGFD